MGMTRFIVFTGGPGGGKTTLINELRQSPDWRGGFYTLPEAIFIAGQVGISFQQPQFQRLMVEIQCALEDSLARSLDSQDDTWVLCHRGSLDPLGYWLRNGWAEADFYTFTHTRRQEHYQRYAAVIHLVTAADGAEPYYRRYPDAIRPELPAEAIRTDRFLEHAWSSHPAYFRIDNIGQDWATKSKAAQQLLTLLRK
jgi:predicted ATPase